MSLLKSSGLFVVNQDDTNYAISTDVLKEYIAPLAKQELGDPYNPGHPGVIMPGDGFVYDESTGLLEINFPEGIVYVGLIGTNTLNDEVLDPDYYGDVPGHFYIVAEQVTLCNDVWPGITKDPSGCREVHINDKVIMNNDEDWDVIPAITEDFIFVGENPPSDPDEGNLWWDTDPDELTLYIYVYDAYGQGQWVPAAPPTSLDGINATINTALAIQEDLLSRVSEGETTQATLQTTVADALDTQNTLKNRVISLEGTVNDNCIKNSGTQILDSSKWRVQQPDSNSVNRSFIEIEDRSMKLFNVQDPTDGADEWAANKGYVDTIGNKKVSKTGSSTVSGEIIFTPSSGYSAFKMRLGGQNTLKLWNSAGESRLHIESGKIFKLTSNVNGTDTQTVKVHESGKIRISNHLLPLESSDVANRQYVDDAIAGSAGRQHPGFGLEWVWKGDDEPIVSKGFTTDSGKWLLIDGEDYGQTDLMKQAFQTDEGGATSGGGVATVYNVIDGKYTPYVIYKIVKMRFGHSKNSRRVLQLEYGGRVQIRALGVEGIYYIHIGGLC